MSETRKKLDKVWYRTLTKYNGGLVAVIIIGTFALTFLGSVIYNHSTFNPYACEFGTIQKGIFLECMAEERWREWCFDLLAKAPYASDPEWIETCATGAPNGYTTDAGTTDDVIEFSIFNFRTDYPEAYIDNPINRGKLGN